jgi:hypothetical protein
MLARTSFVAAAVLVAASCSPAQPEFVVEFATSLGSGEPNLVTAPDGEAVVTWLEKLSDGGHALKLAVRKDGGWSEPRTVVESGEFFVNWADFPSLSVREDGSWIVHWLEKTAPSTYAYHVKLAISNDLGTSWSEPFLAHRDDSETEHGFVSMVPSSDGGTALIWLDGRAMAGSDGGHGSEGAGGAMSIRTTSVGSDSKLGPEVLLDDRVCECCQTSLVETESGLVAAYRDRSETEYRNIAVVREIDGVWTDPAPVHDDGFYYPGCPVNGPQLTAQGDTVAVAWYTAPEQQAAVYAAFSLDGAESFGSTVQIDDGDPLGRVDAEFLPDGRVLVVWIERTPEAAEIRARIISPEGRAGDAFVVGTTSDARGSGFPRMTLAGYDMLVAWTDLGEGDSVVKIASVDVSDLR